MRRPLSLLLTPLVFVATAQPTAADIRSPAHTEKQAEVNVLRVVARKRRARLMPGLVNPRTHLLVDNTEAVCRGRGAWRGGNRYSSFVCVVRPHIHTARQGLYVSYRALPRGRFRIRWLAYSRH